MIEIRIHGRGGQGAVILSKIIAYSYFLEGKYSQSFPTFGAERRGAPVASFVRVDNNFVYLRAPVKSCDYVVVLDSHIAETEDILYGLKREGIVIINSKKGPEHFSVSKEASVKTIDMNKIALEYNLGTKISPFINAVCAGGFGKISRSISLESLKKAVKRFIPVKIDDNIKAMEYTYKYIKI